MKKHLCVVLILWTFGFINSYAQVGQYSNNPNKDAALDLNRTDGTNTKGLLLPKVALTATNSASPMTAHVAGMKVYNTENNGTGATAVTPGIYTNNGTQWIRTETNNTWSIKGNAGTDPSVNFLGTTDANDLVIKTNNTEQMRVANTGQVLIGTNAVPAGAGNAKLIIDNGNKGGAIQLIDGTQANGATLMCDANGVSKWFQGGNNDLGTGIYRSVVAQSFLIGANTALITDKTIKVSEPGNYLVSVRWWGTATFRDPNWQASGTLTLNVNGTAVDTLLQYETIEGNLHDSDNRISFTTNLVALNCAANDILTITINPIQAYWYTGAVGTNANWMPSLIVVKLQ